MEFNNSQPIYKQIIDDFKKKLIRGELKKGDKIPSQREYAEQVKVNPNTVQRAYREMESMNMVETLRGQGTFISISADRLEEIKMEMAVNLLDYFISEMESLGYSREDILKILSQENTNREGEGTL
ncbi:Transcription regulator HTH, GntR [Syntrophomonas zehnderi OL-4]|uniref:Transcription regulator HTH, GntR n=1 Tax=Syntrophomonas zehnderi OL-4 TaxID=690567 RepID=A0A0E3W2E9_9FIRM|nr:GntR family transcriptional regulator [Syntrophomonas zehnderi]CFW96789.1 Transcription regulator HTH, GntR [Syntrophomonas zehnderi OL-4]